MAPDMGILTILVTTAMIAYGPKMLSLQQVTAGASFRELEFSVVPNAESYPDSR